jgi:peroxiredoxin
MKNTVYIVLLALLANSAAAQNEFQECAKKIFLFTDTAATRSEWQNCVSGKQIPDFSVTTISGKKIKTEELRGKVLVINFWFIDCHPCIAELPALNKLADDYKDKNVVFLAITYETIKRLNADFFPKYKFDFTMVSEAGSVIKMFGGTGYPTTYIIDKKGKIKEAWAGGPTDEKAETEAYLKSKPIIDELLKDE